MDLDATTALITGASSGIGREIARELARAGVRTALAARRQRRLEELADALEAEGCVRPVVLPADLSVKGEAAKLAADAVARLGHVDVLVNNAGSGVSGTVWAVADRDEARSTFEVDLWSAAALMSELVPPMRRDRRGAVVNVTSISQIATWPRFGFNAAVKAALAQLTETLRLELAGSGVHVLQVVAGPVETPVQAPTRLIPGIEDAIRARFGEIGRPEVLAVRVVSALREGREHVFYPASVEAMYMAPFDARQAVLAGVRASATDDLNDPMDELVLGIDHPFMQDVREQWESERHISS